MSHYKLLCFLLLFLPLTGKCQKTFLTQIDQQHRAYIYTNSRNTNNPNKPLFLILHETGSDFKEVFNNDKIWDSISTEVNLVFPNSQLRTWDCHDSIAVKNDLHFFREIINSSYHNFKIDRNRVYFLATGESKCIAAKYVENYPEMVAQDVHLNTSNVSEVIKAIETILHTEQQTVTSYQLYKEHVPENKMNSLDSLKRYTYKNRWVLGIHSGGFFMLPSTQTDITDETYMDISDAHALLGFELTKWSTGDFGFFVDISRLKIPKEQKIMGQKMKVGGGFIIPATLGIKYQLVDNYFYKPYVMLGSGFNVLYISGGRIITNKPLPKEQVETQSQWSFQTTIGSGIDVRFGKRIVLGTQIRYTHSNTFESIGSINAIRALNINISAAFILNANNEKGLRIQAD